MRGRCRDHASEPEGWQELSAAPLLERPPQRGLGLTMPESSTFDSAANVRRLLLKRPRELLNLTDAARALELSERTLARRLAGEGTSFLQVLTEVRMTLASDYVRATPLAIGDIARLVGYGDESSFTRDVSSQLRHDAARVPGAEDSHGVVHGVARQNAR